jgi:putative copper resistance protein D
MYGRPSLLLFCEIFHVMAAAGWLGMLPALLLLVSVAPLNAASRALQRFSPFGALCVFVLVATAFCQGLILVGSIHALLTSAYGWMVLVKLALFAVLIGFAYRNQFRLAPRLLATNPEAGRCALRRSILLESIAGLLIVLAAGVLANLPPGMDMM